MEKYKQKAQRYFETALSNDNVLEYQLVKQCAPTLACIKAAGLFGYCYKNPEYVDQTLKSWNKSFNKFGIFIEILQTKAERVLIYCYRKNSLTKILFSSEIKSFLQSRDYHFDTLEQALDVLKSKIVEQQNFPHEIGIFLDYPLGDVQSFIEHQGKNYKYCGEWKVYCNQKHCEDCFFNYNNCRLRFLEAWDKGHDLEKLIVSSAN